jgi:hypothetical protein
MSYYYTLYYISSRLVPPLKLIDTPIQIYKTLTRPTVTYGAETWTLIDTKENALRRFERKVLRQIYGPVIESGVWRIRYNSELYRFTGGEDIVRFIKAQRIQ